MPAARHAPGQVGIDELEQHPSNMSMPDAPVDVGQLEAQRLREKGERPPAARDSLLAAFSVRRLDGTEREPSK